MEHLRQQQLMQQMQMAQQDENGEQIELTPDQIYALQQQILQ